MIKSKYRWDMPKADESESAKLAEKLGIDRLTAAVLAERGRASRELAEAFLVADESGLLDPFAMKDMKAAADRISRAVADGEFIRVYGDYDADGVTSTALMTRLLAKLGARYDYYIPHRSREGYGLNVGAIDSAAEAGVKLIVTVDNGISAVQQIAHAASLGIDVVVTDHHEPPETLPEAVALVNPKQKDCPYPFKGLCGAGVVFKLAHAMFGGPVPEFADLAAIGTIADLMPLEGENRIIAKLGLELMRREPVPGIAALAKVSGAKAEELSSGRIAFSLAPRLNAGGRLEHAGIAVKLLLAEEAEEAEEIAAELDRLNVERQELVERTTAEADAMWRAASAFPDGRPRKAIVLAKEGWNAGIAGLVASKLVERYYMPAIVLAWDETTGMCKGSARSIEGFDLFAALTACVDLMDHFGGHQAAAGMTLEAAKVEALGERLHGLAEERISEEDWQPKRRVDLKASIREATLAAIDGLSKLEPFGNGNPTPRVAILGAVAKESRTMGKEGKHLRVTFEQDGRTIEAVAFGMGEERVRLAEGVRYDLLGELNVNEWNGNRKVQMMLKDYRSDHLFVHDRRASGQSWTSAVDQLLAREGIAVGSNAADDSRTAGGEASFALLCATDEAYREAQERYGAHGVPIGLCADVSEPIEGMAGEIAATGEERQGSVRKCRHVALVGLPDDERGKAVLRRWLMSSPDLESATVLAFGESSVSSAPASSSEPGEFPERKHFAEIYSLCRTKVSWLDSPDGFLRESALNTGWPLATVRMMHDVFIELGFIAANGASRKFVANAPKRDLDQSARYRKARDGAAVEPAARGLSALSPEALKGWLEVCHASANR
ncbi:single-stranded-DNA-specific exonuclease RecJ [Cohnella suwonensis]|uniref:Single-stranded-DNA-specific exonuclease RecJ n=1 Tax=Cohnella suwonensis TaxID=696072 RepID=A0ABW0LUB9_9BACL